MRAPQTRMPRPGNARMQLMPTGLSRSCSLLVSWISRSIAPRTTSLAGALCSRARSMPFRADHDAHDVSSAHEATWRNFSQSRTMAGGRVTADAVKEQANNALKEARPRTRSRDWSASPGTADGAGAAARPPATPR